MCVQTLYGPAKAEKGGQVPQESRGPLEPYLKSPYWSSFFKKQFLSFSTLFFLNKRNRENTPLKKWYEKNKIDHYLV